jgi:hypothetical protein
MMHADDLPGTGLVQNGSRVSYRLLVAGEDRAVAGFRNGWASRPGPRRTPGGSRQCPARTPQALDRAERFLGLATVLTVVLAAVAVAMASRRYMQRHLDACAVMRCLGMTHGRLLRLHAALFLWLALLGAGVGCLLGFAAHFVLIRWLSAGLLDLHLPYAGLAAGSRAGFGVAGCCSSASPFRRCCNWLACRPYACCAANSVRRNRSCSAATRSVLAAGRPAAAGFRRPAPGLLMRSADLPSRWSLFWGCSPGWPSVVVATARGGRLRLAAGAGQSRTACGGQHRAGRRAGLGLMAMLLLTVTRRAARRLAEGDAGRCAEPFHASISSRTSGRPSATRSPPAGSPSSCADGPRATDADRRARRSAPPATRTTSAPSV